MSPRNRLRLILLAEFLRSPRTLFFILIAEILTTVWLAASGFYITAILTASLATLDVGRFGKWVVENRTSRRSR